MKRIAPVTMSALAIAALGVTACGSSTTSNEGTTPGVDLTEPTSTGQVSTSTDDVATFEPVDVPTTDAEVPATDAPAASDSAPAATEPPAPDPTTAPPPPPTTPSATAETAVVYGGGGRNDIPWAPLAWWDGASWNPAGYAEDGSIIAVPAPSIATVAVTSLDLPDGPGQVVTGLSLGAEDFYCVGDEVGPYIELGSPIAATPLSLGYDALAVTADWPLQPRPVTQVGAENPEYQTVGASLIDAPTAASGVVSQVVRADLDGDGVEEVLVTFEYLTETNFGAENDFTSVYLRTPAVDGTVSDQLVVDYVLDDPSDFPTVGRFTIAAVADLNGDGVMEVATRNQFWESAGISIWEFSGGTLSEIGGGGCGV